MNKIGWIIFSAAVVAILGGLIVWARVTNPPIDISSVENNSIIAASNSNGNIGDHVTGSDANKLFLIEYGDYQCVYCSQAYPNVKTILEEYGDDLTFIFRNFPITTAHPNARAAAAVAEAAGLQGKFWEMHDKLYESQNDWSNLGIDQRTTTFSSYAKDMGLDLDKFTADLSSKPVSQKINFDLALGKHVGVSGTPAFFLNGEKLDDESAQSIVQGDLTAIKAKLDALITKDSSN